MRSFVLMLTAVLATPAFAAGAENCLLEVGGTPYIDGPCEVEVEANGDFVLYGPGDEYFAYVYPTDGYGFWNEERGAGHAHSALGDDLKQDGRCWVGSEAKICFDPE